LPNWIGKVWHFLKTLEKAAPLPRLINHGEVWHFLKFRLPRIGTGVQTF
jgi:hypothetical protein